MARSPGGALTKRLEIFLDYVHEFCDSLQRLGTSQVMVINGHSSNKRETLEPKCPELLVRLVAIGIGYITY